MTDKRKKKEEEEILGAIEFVFDCRKMVEVVLYVVDQMGGGINQYNLLKVIFAADKHHVNIYSRTVTGCKYKKLPYGTVPITIYEMLNKKRLKFYLKELGDDKLPFHLDHEGKNYIVHADRKANPDFLSETDIESLQLAMAEYGRLSFKEVQEKNHQERCWLETKMGETIPFELMIHNKMILKEMLQTPFGICV